MKRLTKRDEFGFAYIRASDVIDMEQNQVEAIEKLADYEDAEEQGRLIEFPVAIGDTVYEILSEENPKIEKWKITQLEVWRNGTLAANGAGDSWGRTFRLDNIGRTIFRTRAEAKAKLRELEEQDDNRRSD